LASRSLAATMSIAVWASMVQRYSFPRLDEMAEMLLCSGLKPS
jgi:hypothetical protein